MKKTNPRTVRSVVERLIRYMPSKDQKYLRELPESKLGMLHHSLGRYIRNTFGMWSKNPCLLKDCLKIQRKKYIEDYDKCKKFYGKKKIKIINADDASFVIIKELWKRLSL